MNRALLLFAALAAVSMTLPAAHAWPPCTCDPNPVTDLVKCLKDDRYCEDWPELLLVKRTLEELDPRNDPCTCDPQPQPWGAGPVLLS